jgi:hypothetical protein
MCKSTFDDCKLSLKPNKLGLYCIGGPVKPLDTYNRNTVGTFTGNQSNNLCSTFLQSMPILMNTVHETRTYSGMRGAPHRLQVVRLSIRLCVLFLGLPDVMWRSFIFLNLMGQCLYRFRYILFQEY